MRKTIIKLFQRKKRRELPEKIDKIGLLSLQGIGDTLMNTPAIHEIRKNWPKAKITIFVLSGGVKEILKNNRDIDEIILLPKKTIKFFRQLRKERFDVSFLFWPAGLGSGLANSLLRSKFKVGHQYYLDNKKINFGSDLAPIEELNVHAIHTVEENNKLLKAIGIDVSRKQTYHYNITSEDEEFAKKYWIENNLHDKKIIGIHPGGDKTNPQKRWPIKKTAELVELLAKKNVVEILLGPDEIDLENDFSNIKNVHIVKNTTLGQTAAILKKVDLLVHFDSGNGHLASAVKTKTLTLVGPTNHKRTQPWGENNFTVKAKDVPLCSPCYTYLNFKFNCPHKIKCLESIQPKDIEKAIETLISR